MIHLCSGCLYVTNKAKIEKKAGEGVPELIEKLMKLKD